MAVPKPDDVMQAVGMFSTRILSIIRQFINLEWSATPIGVEWDPIPNPKRYLVATVRIGFMSFAFHLDLGKPGWFGTPSRTQPKT